jgi:hypothetical protein
MCSGQVILATNLEQFQKSSSTVIGGNASLAGCCCSSLFFSQKMASDKNLESNIIVTNIKYDSLLSEFCGRNR